MEDAALLAALRLVPGIEVAEADKTIWLRGKHCDEHLGTRLAVLPASGRFEWMAPNRLRRIDQRIPSACLPELRWLPLDAWLRVDVAVAAMPAHGPERVPLQLARSTEEREPELLLTNLKSLKDFAATAARIRLEHLRFAVNAAGDVLLRGTPLPPLTGRRFALHGGIAVPAGFSWQPAVGADVLARSFGVSGDALLVWNEDGTVTRLHTEQFIPLTRSAVLATDQALAESS